MVEGSVQKYLKEVSLFNQALREERQADGGADAQRTHHRGGYSRCTWWARGIEKKVDDFAAEVAAQVLPPPGQRLRFTLALHDKMAARIKLLPDPSWSPVNGGLQAHPAEVVRARP